MFTVIKFNSKQIKTNPDNRDDFTSELKQCSWTIRLYYIHVCTYNSFNNAVNEIKNVHDHANNCFQIKFKHIAKAKLS